CCAASAAPMRTCRMPEAALRELVALAGIAGPDDGQVSIAGDDPMVPTPYRVGAAGAAALAATGLAAAQLWELRTGRGRRVAADVRAAVASLRSARYLRVDGQKTAEPWAALSGFYPARDGRWVQLHCNFANHRAAALAVLGTPEDRDAAVAASRAWDGGALE